MRKLELIFDEKTAFHTLEYVMKNSLGLTKRQISQAKFGERGICVNGKRQPEPDWENRKEEEFSKRNIWGWYRDI